MKADFEQDDVEITIKGKGRIGSGGSFVPHWLTWGAIWLAVLAGLSAVRGCR